MTKAWSLDAVQGKNLCHSDNPTRHRNILVREKKFYSTAQKSYLYLSLNFKQVTKETLRKRKKVRHEKLIYV